MVLEISPCKRNDEFLAFLSSVLVARSDFILSYVFSDLSQLEPRTLVSNRCCLDGFFSAPRTKYAFAGKNVGQTAIARISMAIEQIPCIVVLRFKPHASPECFEISG